MSDAMGRVLLLDRRIEQVRQLLQLARAVNDQTAVTYCLGRLERLAQRRVHELARTLPASEDEAGP
jgi:hypothetical protein